MPFFIIGWCQARVFQVETYPTGHGVTKLTVNFMEHDPESGGARSHHRTQAVNCHQCPDGSAISHHDRSRTITDKWLCEYKSERPYQSLKNRPSEEYRLMNN